MPRFLDPGRTTIVKLYGDVQQRDTLVVTEDDLYGLWRNRDKEELLAEARQALSRTLVLFVGHDLASPDFLLLWREVLDRVGRFGAGAYAAMPTLPADEVQVWSDRQIQIIDQPPLAVLTDLAALIDPDGTQPSAPAAPEPVPPVRALTPEQASIIQIKRRRLHELEKQAALNGIRHRCISRSKSRICATRSAGWRREADSLHPNIGSNTTLTLRPRARSERCGMMQGTRKPEGPAGLAPVPADCAGRCHALYVILFSRIMRVWCDHPKG